MTGKTIALALLAVFVAATTVWAFGGGGGAGGGSFGGTTVDLLMPSPPKNVTAVAGDSMATITFDPPKTDGGSSVTAYIAISSPGGIRAKGAGSPIVVRGLTKGKAYTFTVRASNSVGTGLDSYPSNCVKPE